MGLVSHGLAVGLGYLLGRPEGRQRLAQVGQQAADLARRPEVAQLRERGKGLAVEQAQVVKQKVLTRSKSDDSPSGHADVDAIATVVGADAAGGRPRRGLRNSAWLRRFPRSRAAHFPPSEGSAPPASLGGTTVAEDSEAAALGMAVKASPGVSTPPTDRS
jgi:hypothetical protein